MAVYCAKLRAAPSDRPAVLRPRRRIEQSALDGVGAARLDRIALNERRHARVAFGGRSYVVVGAERTGDLLRQESAHGHPRDAAHDLADKVAHVEAVVAACGARLPPWLLTREQ